MSILRKPKVSLFLITGCTGGGKTALIDAKAFARRAYGMARDDLAQARAVSGPAFVDAERSYCAAVFAAPPWPEIHRTDSERRHSFEHALAEYHRIEQALIEQRYQTHILPKHPMTGSMNFVLAKCSVAGR